MSRGEKYFAPTGHYPNVPLMRNAHQSALKAIATLDAMAIEIESMTITNYQPTISVAHCQKNYQLFGTMAGKTADAGTRYTRRDAMLHGCKIVWIEREGA